MSPANQPWVPVGPVACQQLMLAQEVDPTFLWQLHKCEGTTVVDGGQDWLLMGTAQVPLMACPTAPSSSFQLLLLLLLPEGGGGGCG